MAGLLAQTSALIFILSKVVVDPAISQAIVGEYNLTFLKLFWNSEMV